MRAFNRLFRRILAISSTPTKPSRSPSHPLRSTNNLCTSYPTRQPHHAFSSIPRRPASQPADDPNFTSLVDNPPQLVRVGADRKHGLGLIILAAIPLTAFALGTWQISRLRWKTDLVAKYEDRLSRPPLPLPPHIDASPDVQAQFNYRRVTTTGRFRHDREMLLGPRTRGGENGFFVVTPLERGGKDGPATTVLVNRGWISKRFRDQRSRAPESIPEGEVRVEGMLREPWKRNVFTPENRPNQEEWYFPDIRQMAEASGAEPVWIEQTMRPDYFEILECEKKGIPIGGPAALKIRNNHAQYIFTWYGLGVATSIMFYMLVKKPSSDVARRLRMNKNW